MDFINFLAVACRKVDLPIREIIDGLIDYYHFEARYPDHPALLAQNVQRRQRLARIRNERTAQGVCMYCGKRPVVPGYRGCAECLEANRERVRRWQKWCPEEVAGE